MAGACTPMGIADPVDPVITIFADSTKGFAVYLGIFGKLDKAGKSDDIFLKCFKNTNLGQMLADPTNLAIHTSKSVKSFAQYQDATGNDVTGIYQLQLKELDKFSRIVAGDLHFVSLQGEVWHFELYDDISDSTPKVISLPKLYTP